MEMEGAVFDISDFTLVTEWEHFVAKVETLLNEQFAELDKRKCKLPSVRAPSTR